MPLADIRRAAGKTQVDAAKAMGINQGDVSRIENGTDHLVSTLRRYVEAVGGELILAARIGRKTVDLTRGPRRVRR